MRTANCMPHATLPAASHHRLREAKHKCGGPILVTTVHLSTYFRAPQSLRCTRYVRVRLLLLLASLQARAHWLARNAAARLTSELQCAANGGGSGGAGTPPSSAPPPPPPLQSLDMLGLRYTLTASNGSILAASSQPPRDYVTEPVYVPGEEVSQRRGRGTGIPHTGTIMASVGLMHLDLRQSPKGQWGMQTMQCALR